MTPDPGWDEDEDPADRPAEHWEPRARHPQDAKACRREHKAFWRVTLYRASRSGGHRAESGSSTVTCTAPGCGREWRTGAAYVDKLMRGRTPQPGTELRAGPGPRGGVAWARCGSREGPAG
jgi:hypothetical protein